MQSSFPFLNFDRTAAAVGAVLSVVFAIQLNATKDERNQLFRELRMPTVGAAVPTVAAQTLDRNSVALGSPAAKSTQVLFFFSTTCPYCIESIDAVHVLAFDKPAAQ